MELSATESGGVLGHARLLASSVVGCWFGLERSTGRRLWNGLAAPANDVFASTGGVLVATQVVGRGKLSEMAGLWGVEAATGRLLWGERRAGLCRRLARKLTGGGEPGDGPLAAHGGRVYTREHRVLDARTGLELEDPGPVPAEPSGPPDEELSTELFFLRRVALPGAGSELVRQFDPKDPLGHLKHERCAHPEPVPMNFGAIDASGHVLWERRYGGGRRVGTSYLGSRLMAGRLLLIETAGEAASLAAVDAHTGRQEQLLPLGSALACIQDLDAGGVLLGLGAETSSGISALALYGVA